MICWSSFSSHGFQSWVNLLCWQISNMWHPVLTGSLAAFRFPLAADTPLSERQCCDFYHHGALSDSCSDRSTSSLIRFQDVQTDFTVVHIVCRASSWDVKFNISSYVTKRLPITNSQSYQNINIVLGVWILHGLISEALEVFNIRNTTQFVMNYIITRQ